MYCIREANALEAENYTINKAIHCACRLSLAGKSASPVSGSRITATFMMYAFGGFGYSAFEIA